MKKNLTILIHIFAVLLFVAGLGVLHGYSRNETGITWMSQTTFENSALFSEMVADDIANLKKLAVLKDAFEDEGDGELDTSAMVVTAQTKNGKTFYKLSDLIAAAARYGYTMDENTHRITAGDIREQEQPYELRVTYKAFDPYYFDNLEPGPSQGITNIRDISLEALKALSEYYRLRAIYDPELSNFIYNISFESPNHYDIQLSNSSRTTDEIKSLGKYLIVTEDRTVETNISPQPENLLSSDNSFELSSYEGNPIAIGIDTTYIFNDRYKKAADNFDNDIRTVRNWLVIMALCSVAALASLVLCIRGFDENDKKELVMDKIPLEALVFLFSCLSLIIYVVFKLTVNFAFEELLEYNEWEYWRDMAKGVIIWFLCTAIAGSMYRREINGGCFKYSLINGLFKALSNEDDGRAAWAALKGYVSFIFINIAAVLLIMNCYSSRIEGPIYTIAMVIGLLLLLAFDIFIYVVRCRTFKQRDIIRKAIKDIAGGSIDCEMDESQFTGDTLEIARSMNNISVGLQTAINEQVKADKLKADLITNVSHDIRTPLTSIINYVDLMKRENIQDPKLKEYIEVLEKKSARLKNLTEDLLEASKASSGNIKMDMQRIDMVELVIQAGGELEDKFLKRKLDLELSVPEHPVYVMADGRHLWRVLENLYNNAAKYALEGTRVYVSVEEEDNKAKFTIKNISADKLNISPEELTERFVRGDVSRNTEGSGLGLNIATSLTKLMGGELVIEIDGDLYKANVILDIYTEKENTIDEDKTHQGI